MRFPIAYFTHNIIFNRRGEAFAVYRLAGRPYRYLPAEQKSLAVRLFEEFLYGFAGRAALLLLTEELRPTEAGYFVAAGVRRDGLPPGAAGEAAGVAEGTDGMAGVGNHGRETTVRLGKYFW